MLREIDEHFLNQPEPIKSCLLYLRDFILDYDTNIEEAWRYKMPFYYYKGKMFCYLWTHKKYKQPYLGIVEGRQINHPELLSEARSKMKILLINPYEDIPIDKIKDILDLTIGLYK